MYRILVCALLLLSAPLALNQQPQQPGQSRPPYTTPPTFPENHPKNEPPLAVSPDQVPAASSDIQDQLQQTLRKDPDLKDAQVQTRVDDQTITLKGTVQDDIQHQRVLQLVQTYAGKRKIVDDLIVKQKS
ncbi:MAG TPA: BON domain-containing protein [Candidatus Angelobacter sp.]|jgi:hypothetical protein|nr:BON domain-containing protein [Candidatus Angelobacter sp.]